MRRVDTARSDRCWHRARAREELSERLV